MSTTTVATVVEYVGGYFRPSGEWVQFMALQPRADRAQAQRELDSLAATYASEGHPGAAPRSNVARACRDGLTALGSRTITTSDWQPTSVLVNVPDAVDEHPHPNMTVRRGHPLGTALFVDGWRVGFYKTDAGLQRAIDRHAKAGA